VQIIRVADQPDMPWKNGGGTTRELLAAPPGDQGLAWRISVATIARDGPFSRFPGVERTLVGLAGVGVLRVSGRLVDVEPGTILRFDGEEAVSAIVGATPMRVLNVMATARDWRQEVGAPRPIRPAPWQDEQPHMFVAMQEGPRLHLRSGDLIREIGMDDPFDGLSAIEIRLLSRRTPPSDG
jgi:environmental stress-induced protein Ves